MWRVIFVLAAALIVGHASGIFDSCDDGSCVDDDRGAPCPPSCPTCTCAGHATPSLLPVQVSTVLRSVSSHVVEMQYPRIVRGRHAPAPLTRPPIS